MSDADLDTSANVGNTTNSEPTPATATGDAATATVSDSAATPDTSTAQANGASAEQASVDTLTPSENGAQSAQDGAETSTPDATDDAATWKKRFAGSTRSYQQEKAAREAKEQELEQLKRQLEAYQGIDPREIQSFQQSRQGKPWDETHPEHQHFRELYQKAQYFDELIRDEPDPAFRERLAQKQQVALGAEGIKLLREWRADVQRQERERQLNPDAYYRKLLQKEFQPLIQSREQELAKRYQEAEEGRRGVEGWVKSNPEIAKAENIQKILGLMERGETFKDAAAIVERDHYRSLVSGASQAKASAEEKERILQGNASGAMARNPNVSKFVDPVKATAGARNSREAADILLRLEHAGRLPQRR